MKKEILQRLTEEQREKALKCKNKDELLQLAKEEGVDLTDEELDAVNGGTCSGTEEPRRCPNCGSTNLKETRESGREAQTRFECLDCGAEWYVR